MKIGAGGRGAKSGRGAVVGSQSCAWPCRHGEMITSHQAIPVRGTAHHLSHGNYPLDKSARAALAQTVW